MNLIKYKYFEKNYFNIIVFHRLYGQNIAVVANEVGRKPPSFLDASKVANELLQLNYDSGKIVFNRFKYNSYNFIKIFQKIII